MTLLARVGMGLVILGVTAAAIFASMHLRESAALLLITLAALMAWRPRGSLLSLLDLADCWGGDVGEA